MGRNSDPKLKGVLRCASIACLMLPSCFWMIDQFASAASEVCSNENSVECGEGHDEAAIFWSIWMRFLGQQWEMFGFG